MERPHRLRRGDHIEAPVETLAFGGKGIARLDDFVVFVNGAVPGDVVRAVITKNKRRYAEARAVELLQPSPDRIEPRCPAFGGCGGCVWQNLDYHVQLDYKARQVQESLEHLGGLRDFEMRPALALTDPWRYRNRADFSIGAGPDGLVIGFRPPGRWDTVLPLTECHLVSPGMESVRSQVETWLRTHDVPPWDPRTHTGFARHLLVRTSQLGGEMLVSLVTAPGDLPDEAGFVAALRAAHPELVGIMHAVNDGRAEISSGVEARTLWGRPFLYEELAGVTLKISLDAFFQTNTLMAHGLYELVRREVFAPLSAGRPATTAAAEATETTTIDAGATDEAAAAAGSPAADGAAVPTGRATDRRPVIWDLYSGVGSIGLMLAGGAKAVLGIEAVSAAVRDAEENARLNNITNATFIEGDTRRVLRELAQGLRTLPEGLERPDVVVVDPPRAGLHQRVVARVGELGAPRIVYVSCNPSTMAPNVAQLQEHGYRLTHVTPVDMFPHTPHVEAVASLARLP